jgi:hypothetical protein
MLLLYAIYLLSGIFPESDLVPTTDEEYSPLLHIRGIPEAR